MRAIPLLLVIAGLAASAWAFYALLGDHVRDPFARLKRAVPNQRRAAGASQTNREGGRERGVIDRARAVVERADRHSERFTQHGDIAIKLHS